MIARCAFGLVLAATVAHAQPAATSPFVEENQAWFALFSQVSLGDRWVAWFDEQARASHDGKTVAVLTRPGIGLRVRPDMVAWVGYAWTPVFREGALALDEHRVWQQWTWELPLPLGGRLQLRTRLEERLAGGEVGLRLRQFVRAQTAYLGGGPVLLALWDEVFFAINDTVFGQQAGFDQNRLFAGVGVKLGEGVRLEAGYFNQLVHRRDAPDPVRHVAAVNLFVTQ